MRRETQYVRVDVDGRAYTWSWKGEPLLEPGQTVVAKHPLTGKPVTGRVIRQVALIDHSRVAEIDPYKTVQRKQIEGDFG